MKTENELIAEFMGYEVLDKYPRHNIGAPESGGRKYYLQDKMKFHTSWDWLMPVVEKIYEVHPQAFDVDHELGPLSDLAGIQICDGIERIYQAVVEFIRWYNSQNS